MFREINEREMVEIDGGITLIAALLIGGGVLLGGTGLGLGTAYVVSKL